MQRSAPTQESFNTFSATLQAHGVRESLAFLVGLTEYRFIGIWRFQGGRANAAVHYDRENPTVLYTQAVPDTATYCCYVRDSKGVFMTAHALLDPGTPGHPAASRWRSHCMPSIALRPVYAPIAPGPIAASSPQRGTRQVP